jgi:hypothetical protein
VERLARDAEGHFHSHSIAICFYNQSLTFDGYHAGILLTSEAGYSQ